MAAKITNDDLKKLDSGEYLVVGIRWTDTKGDVVFVRPNKQEKYQWRISDGDEFREHYVTPSLGEVIKLANRMWKKQSCFELSGVTS